MPYIIITNGPTGSGKSSLIDKVRRRYKLEDRYTKILIDDIIEFNTFYKNEIDIIIREMCDDSLVLCKRLEEELLNPNPIFLKRFNKLYKKIRGIEDKERKEDGEHFCIKNGKPMTCDKYNDILLGQALRERNNIVFETTGGYFIKWLFDIISGVKYDLQNDAIYDVYYAYTILDFCELITRNKLRALETTRKYLTNTSIYPAPRLPDVSEDNYNKNLSIILRQLYEFIYQKQKGMYDNINFIVYDNTSRNDVIVYDSTNEEHLRNPQIYVERIKDIVNIRRCDPNIYLNKLS